LLCILVYDNSLEMSRWKHSCTADYQSGWIGKVENWYHGIQAIWSKFM
jgi:hypothetical protein